MSFVHFGTSSNLTLNVFQYLLFFLTYSTLTKSTCYYPNGNPNEDVPCATNSSADYCCEKESICLTNKICLNNIGTFNRGSCTDKTWNSPGCPLFCIAEPPNNGALMVACKPLSSGTWCCQNTMGKDTCCNDSENLVTLGQASIISSTPSISNTLAASTSSTAATASTTTTASTAFAPLSSTSTAVSSATTRPTSVPASSSGLSGSAKVGIGIGVPLGVVIIVLLICLLYRNKHVHAKTQSYDARKNHPQEGMKNIFQRQAYTAELEQHQDPHELPSTNHHLIEHDRL